METNARNIWAAALVLLALPSALAYASTEGFGTNGYVYDGYQAATCKSVNDTKDYIIASGEATVTVDSTIMIAHLNFVSRGDTAKDAYGQQSGVMEKVTAMLKSKGITEMQTINFAIEPIYSEKIDYVAHSDWEAISHYKVRNTLVIKVRDPKLFEDILVEATDLGVNEITDMRFIPDATKIKEAKRRVRELALADAKETAVWQSEVVGRPLGDIVFVGDSSSDVVRSGGYDRYEQNLMAQTSQYLSYGDVEEIQDSLSPGRVTFRAGASVGYLLEEA